MIPPPHTEHPDPDDPLYDPEDDDAGHDFVCFIFDPFQEQETNP